MKIPELEINDMGCMLITISCISNGSMTPNEIIDELLVSGGIKSERILKIFDIIRDANPQYLNYHFEFTTEDEKD